MSDDDKTAPVPDFVHEAQAAKLNAEAHKLEAEALRATKQAELADHEAAMSAINRQVLEHENNRRLAHNEFYRKFYFDDPVTSGTAETCITVLDQWNRMTPGCDMEIIFSSPGGSVIDGLRLFDHIQILRRKGHKITTGCTGYAASMAGILLQAGDVRWMSEESWVLIHEVSFGSHGSMGQVVDQVEWIKRIQKRVLQIFATRSSQAKENGTAVKALSVSQLEKGWLRKDWWLSSDECLKLGIVDEVR